MKTIIMKKLDDYRSKRKKIKYLNEEASVEK